MVLQRTTAFFPTGAGFNVVTQREELELPLFQENLGRDYCETRYEDPKRIISPASSQSCLVSWRKSRNDSDCSRVRRPDHCNSEKLSAQVGGVIQVANTLFATDKGFTVAGSTLSATSCAVPVVFLTTPQTANTNITAGHLVYDVQVNSTSSSPLGKSLNVTLVLSGTTYGPVCIKTAASPLVGTIDCKLDIGSSTLPPSPYTFKVSIQ